MLFATCPQPHPATHTRLLTTWGLVYMDHKVRAAGFINMCLVKAKTSSTNKKKGLPKWCIPVKQQLVGSVEDLKSNSLSLVELPMRRVALCIQLL